MTQPNYITSFPDLFKPNCDCEVGKGWHQLVFDMCAEIIVLMENNKNIRGVEFVQIKEKFGTLRAYNQIILGKPNVNEDYVKVDTIVSKYERLSSQICEMCGKPGQLSGGGWLKTLCDEHRGNRPLVPRI